MPGSPFPPRVLLVEGQDDKHVTGHIITRTKLNSGIDIDIEKDIAIRGGVDSLIDSIRSAVDAPNQEVVGILADANDHPYERWESITGRLLESNGFRDASLPEHPDPAGTIITEGPRSPRVGIWLMPDNGSPGELEDFVGRMIPPDDTVWPLAQEYVDGIPQADRKFAKGKTQRAKVHVWLATSKDPQRMGVAIRDGDLTTEAPLCQSFADWLRRLFAP